MARPITDPHQRAAILHLPDSPEPRADDVASPEAIVRAVYESISGPAEKDPPRDWNRLRSLLLPDARFVLVSCPIPDAYLRVDGS